MVTLIFLNVLISLSLDVCPVLYSCRVSLTQQPPGCTWITFYFNMYTASDWFRSGLPDTSMSLRRVNSESTPSVMWGFTRINFRAPAFLPLSASSALILRTQGIVFHCYADDSHIPLTSPIVSKCCFSSPNDRVKRSVSLPFWPLHWLPGAFPFLTVILKLAFTASLLPSYDSLILHFFSAFTICLLFYTFLYALYGTFSQLWLFLMFFVKKILSLLFTVRLNWRKKSS